MVIDGHELFMAQGYHPFDYLPVQMVWRDFCYTSCGREYTLLKNDLQSILSTVYGLITPASSDFHQHIFGCNILFYSAAELVALPLDSK